MKEKTINKLLQVNNEFYNKNSINFNRTRKLHWRGWENLNFDIILKNKKELLDIGCGNGRLIKFLLDFYQLEFSKIKYTGVDYSDNFLILAQEKFSSLQNVKFICDSFFKIFTSKTDKFDVVTAFAIYHHIPGSVNRFQFLKKIYNILNDDGFFIITFWQFKKCRKLRKKIISMPVILKQIDIDIEDLETNDFFLNFNDSDIPRYCHYTDDKELDKIKTFLVDIGFKLLNEFTSDGSENNLNKYLLLKK